MSGFGSYGLKDFPKNEYKSRWEKAKKLMEEKHIDALLLTQDENVNYFSGFRYTWYIEVSYRNFLILPLDGEPTLVTPVSMRGNVEAMTWMENVTYFGKDLGGDPAEIVAEVLKKQGLSNKVIGTEIDHSMRIWVSQRDFEAIRRGLPKAEFVDASKLIWKLRTIKSPLEIEYTKRSVEISCKAFEKGFESLKEGMSECEFAKIIFKAMLDEGADLGPIKAGLNCRAGSERYTQYNARPSNRRFKKGDIVICDGGTTYMGYYSDITRLACIGKPSKKQREMFDIAREAEEVAVKAIRPEVKVSDVCAVALDVIKNGGFGEHLLSEGVGHGLGLEIHEPPWLELRSEERLQPGMIITVEPCIYDTPTVNFLKLKGGKYSIGGEGVFFVEDNILVTESGHENLSPLSKDLWIVS